MTTGFYILMTGPAALCPFGADSAGAWDNGATSRSSCLPENVVEGADLVLLGMYGGGGTPMPYFLAGTRRPANVVSVAGHLSRPTVLILAAYEATIWDLSGLTGRPPSGIYASGFHSQGVTGINAGVPIVFRHTVAGGRPDPESANGPCPDLQWPHSRPEAMSTAIAIRRTFRKWPTEFYGSYAPFSFRIGQGEVPRRAAIPHPEDVRSEGPMVLGDAAAQRSSAMFNHTLSLEEEPERAGERQAERRGRRLLHIRWNRRGDIISIEPELFGGDEWRERISQGD